MRFSPPTQARPGERRLNVLERIVSHFSHLRTGERRGEEDPRFASSLPSYNEIMQRGTSQIMPGIVTIEA